MVQAVIFDKDGVLVDTEGIIGEVIKTIIERNSNIPYNLQDNIELRGITAVDTAPILIDKYGLSFSPQEFLQEYSDEYKKRITKDSNIVIDGVEDLLKGLIETGIKIAVGTNSNKERTDISLKQLESYFKVVVVASDVPFPKPAPDVFLEAAQRLGVEPKDCVVIGDTNNDAVGAKKAGMKFIFFDHNVGVVLGIEPDRVIHSMREVSASDIKEM